MISSREREEEMEKTEVSPGPRKPQQKLSKLQATSLYRRRGLKVTLAKLEAAESENSHKLRRT